MSLPKDSGKEKNGLASISFSLSLDQDLKQSPKNENDCPINSPKMASLIINIHVSLIISLSSKQRKSFPLPQ